ncbi:MAG: DUF3362 domain-containing protein [Deltaproteobacteria bacterium]|nr:DUF3362 domain-containing protein [Deltaproteobacteria bacterium]
MRPPGHRARGDGGVGAVHEGARAPAAPGADVHAHPGDDLHRHLPLRGRPLDPAAGARGTGFYWKREEWPHVREALLEWGRGDLIGRGAQYLVPPGPAYAARSR